MSPSEFATATIDKVRAALHNAEAELTTLASPTFLEQEPDLAKEAGLYNREASALAASGTPVAD